jgi:hypothetical protein
MRRVPQLISGRLVSNVLLSAISWHSQIWTWLGEADRAENLLTAMLEGVEPVSRENTNRKDAIQSQILECSARPTGVLRPKSISLT